MNAQVMLGKAKFTVCAVDRLHVAGSLVEIQRFGPDGYETVAVAGEDVLVTLEPAGLAKVDVTHDEREASFWSAMGVPMD